MNKSQTSKLISEDQLVLGLKKRDKESLSYVYDKYGPALFGIANRIVKDQEVSREVVQDVFLKIWNKIDSYDAKKGKFFTWMLNITRNEAINKIRSKEIKRSTKTDSLDNYVYNVEDNETRAKVEGLGVRELISKLEPDHQFVLTKVYFEGFSHSEVANSFKIPLGTVKSRLRAALKLLRKKQNI